MRLKLLVGAIATFVVGLAVLGTLAFDAKHGRGRILEAVAIGRSVVMHQRARAVERAPGRVGGEGGLVALDRLVVIDGRDGRELARKRVPRGELLGARDGLLVYAEGDDLALYDPVSLDRYDDTTQGARPLPLTRYGALTDLRDAMLFLDEPAGAPAAQASRLTHEDKMHVWSTYLPWKGHDTKLVAIFEPNVVIVDTDGAVGLERRQGSLAWWHRP